MSRQLSLLLEARGFGSRAAKIEFPVSLDIAEMRKGPAVDSPGIPVPGRQNSIYCVS